MVLKFKCFSLNIKDMIFQSSRNIIWSSKIACTSPKLAALFNVQAEPVFLYSSSPVHQSNNTSYANKQHYTKALKSKYKRYAPIETNGSDSKHHQKSSLSLFSQESLWEEQSSKAENCLSIAFGLEREKCKNLSESNPLASGAQPFLSCRSVPHVAQARALLFPSLRLRWSLGVALDWRWMEEQGWGNALHFQCIQKHFSEFCTQLAIQFHIYLFSWLVYMPVRQSTAPSV